MTDDIVTRLRMQAELTDAFPTMKAKDVAPTTWVNEAADEIERLRAELAMAQKWRDNFQLAFEKERKKTEYWHGKAVRGE